MSKVKKRRKQYNLVIRNKTSSTKMGNETTK